MLAEVVKVSEQSPTEKDTGGFRSTNLKHSLVD